jgi:hypothetical protein
MASRIQERIFYAPAESFITSSAGLEDGKGYIVAPINTEGDLIGKENAIIRVIGGANRFLEASEIPEGIEVYNRNKGKKYGWNGIEWGIGGQEKVINELIDVVGDKVTFSYMPSGDVITAVLGFYANDTFYSKENGQIILKEEDFEGNIATLLKSHPEGTKLSVSYLTSGQAITAPSVPFNPDATLTHQAAAINNATLVTVDGTGTPADTGASFKFVNLNSTQDPVMDGKQMIIMNGGQPIAQVNFVADYVGKAYELHLSDGTILEGTFIDGDSTPTVKA